MPYVILKPNLCYLSILLLSHTKQNIERILLLLLNNNK